ncbi:Nicotinate N-methyltransferase 1 [Linum perenne]
MGMEDGESSERRKNARLAILEFSNMISVPMSLTALVRLNVPELIWQGGAHVPLSAADILSRIHHCPAADPANLQRFLRLLSSHGVFHEHIDSGERKYSLTEIGMTLVTDSEGLSFAPYILQHYHDALMRAWPYAHEMVVDPTAAPFVKANGELPYTYYGKRPEMTELMQKAMSGTNAPFMKAMLDGYRGFDGVKKLVDVGGSRGDCLQMILRKFPCIREAINFELPEVVAIAPPIPGVTHVAGDMFKSIPSGDAIFMKWTLTAWTDEQCKMVMENCYKALPEDGKLIVCEPVLPEDSDESLRTKTLLEGDVFIMTIYGSKTKHRTEAEFKQLGHSGGFKKFKAIYSVDYFHTILEFQK